MKNYFLKLTVVFALAIQLACCEDHIPSRYALEFPAPPETWVSLLGEPHWRVEWLAADGRKQHTDISPGGSLEVELPVTWTNPVTAWPFWPDRNLIPGFFKPAGALFPFDACADRLRLSWEAGPDTVFFWELAAADSQNASRIPAYFDWPRFRELFNPETLAEAVCKDPWVVDWRYVAERTAASGFDRRRIVREAAESVNIPVPAGHWYGTSPFAEPLYFDFDEGKEPAFERRAGINVWVSDAGILRINGNVWVLTER